MKQKIIVMLAAMCLAVSLCSCGSGDKLPGNAEPSPSLDVTEKAEDKDTAEKAETKEQVPENDGTELREDAKIEFGKDNKEQKQETPKPEQPKQEKEPENRTETKPSAADEQGYGEVIWN